MGNLIFSRKDVNILQFDSNLRLVNADSYRENFKNVFFACKWKEVDSLVSIQVWPDSYNATLNLYRWKIQACYFLHHLKLTQIRSRLELLNPFNTTWLDIKESLF